VICLTFQILDSMTFSTIIMLCSGADYDRKTKFQGLQTSLQWSSLMLQFSYDFCWVSAQFTNIPICQYYFNSTFKCIVKELGLHDTDSDARTDWSGED